MFQIKSMALLTKLESIKDEFIMIFNVNPTTFDEKYTNMEKGVEFIKDLSSIQIVLCTLVVKLEGMKTTLVGADIDQYLADNITAFVKGCKDYELVISMDQIVYKNIELKELEDLIEKISIIEREFLVNY